MSHELYLQHLRREYIQMGEHYLQAIRAGQPATDVREIARTIKSVLTEIKALEQELKRKVA